MCRPAPSVECSAATIAAAIPLPIHGYKRNLNASRTVREWENYASTTGQWEGHVQEKQALAQDLFEKTAEVRSASKRRVIRFPPVAGR
jgi:hypothetical protein